MVMNLNDFVINFSVRDKKQFAFFLGAGASASSNVPTALEMIWDFKRRLYAAEKNFKVSMIEQRDYSFREEIEGWVKLKHQNTSENDYGYFFEKAFTTKQSRKDYINETLEFSKPSIGYQIIRFLIEQEIVRHFITTNFDNLIQKVYPDISQITESNITNCKDMIRVNYNHPLLIKVHGDFRYDWLKNTSSETKELNREITSSIAELFKSLGLIVMGYSGRDDSVMTFIEEFVSKENKPFLNGLYWCLRDGDLVNPRVNQIIEKVRSKNINADIVKIPSFDDLLIGIYNQQKVNDKTIDKWLGNNRILQPFVSPTKAGTSFIVLNFMKIIEFPKSLLTFRFKNIPDWERLDKLTENKFIAASFFREGKIIALGDEDEIKKLFKPYLANNSRFEYYVITSRDLESINKQHGFIYGIFYRLFNWHFANTIKLKQYGKSIFYQDKLHKRDLPRYQTSLSYHKGFKYKLEYRDGNLALVITPYYLTFNFQSLDEETFKARQNFLISNIWNKDVLEDMIELLAILKNGKQNVHIMYPSDISRFLIHPQYFKSIEGVNE